MDTAASTPATNSMPTAFAILILLLGIAIVGGLIALIIVLATRKKTPADPNAPIPTSEDSYFDGNFWQRLGWTILSRLLTVITLGLAYPAAVCMLLRWECAHTVINGRRLKFTGTGGQLFGKYILWWLLTVVTFGIFGIWLGLNIQKWTVKHTVYADDNSQAVSRFTGGVGGYWGIRLLAGLLTVFTFGIGAAWAKRMIISWEMKHTYISGTHLSFNGSGGQLFGKYLLWGLLTVVTFSIFSLFIPIKFLKWKYKHTCATRVAEVPPERRTGVGAIIAAVVIGVVVLALVLGAIGLYVFQMPVASHPTPISPYTVLNGSGNLIPSPTDAADLPGNFENSERYFAFDGTDFSYSLDAALLPESLYHLDWAHTYFTANGTIGSTAYLDVEQDILYLDYAVENANCPTYLSLDSAQTSTGYAEPLTRIVSGGKGVHSVYYPYDTAPEYVYVMAFIHNGDNYHFVQLHKQALNVISGTTEELKALRSDSGEQATVPLEGHWIAVAEPSSAGDEYHSYFADGAYYTFSTDGTFQYYQLRLAKSEGWYHMGGGESSYAGTYAYDGTTLTLYYTTYYERYFNEELGFEDVRPVEFSSIEQFQFQLAEDGLTTNVSEHPRLGELLTFEYRNTNDPILEMLSILTQNY